MYFLFIILQRTFPILSQHNNIVCQRVMVMSTHLISVLATFLRYLFQIAREILVRVN